MQPLLRTLDVILRNWRKSVFGRLGVFAIFALVSTSVAASDFHFDRETFAFANQTVFEYREGHAYAREKTNEHKKAYNRRCFVLCRAAMQFHKFARFDARGGPLDDKSLAARIRDVTRRTAWAASLPENQRVVFPGYADLREMSKARQGILQENIGLGWPTYLRPGNGRMFFQHDPRYQEETHANLNATLARWQLLVGYLATYPRLYINHSILVYRRKSVSPSSGIERYIAYDPNHPEAPRELTWFSRTRAFAYQKDWDFIGGFVRVFQVYGKPLQ